MLKSKDFYLKNIYSSEWKRLGVIDDVIEIGRDIIVFKEKHGNGLGFKSLKNMEVIDINGSIKGVLEDIIIDDYNYSIKGIVISSGLIDRLIKGKEILLLEQCVLGDEYILYTGKNNVMFKTMPHNMENV